MTDSFSAADIAAFLNRIRDTRRQLRSAEADQEEAELQIFDLLHALELGTYDAVSMVRLAKLLKQARKNRRRAKEAEERLGPIVLWVEQNPGAVKSLERLLGEERKIESKQAGRIYAPRTNILEQVQPKAAPERSNPDVSEG